MADTEAQPVAVAETAPEAAATEAATTEDTATEESKAEGKPERKKREYKEPKEVPAPDTQAFEEKKQELDDSIAEIQTKINAISSNIDVKSAERKSYRDGKKATLDKLLERKALRSTLIEDLNKIRAQFDEILIKREGQRAFLQQQKNGLKFTKLADLDAAVATIELALNTGTAPRSLHDDLRLLKSQRMSVIRYSEQLAMVKASKEDTVAMRKEREEKSKTLRGMKDVDAKASKELNELRRKERVSNSEIEDFIKERKTHSNQKYKIQKTRDTILYKYNAQEREYSRWVEFCKYQARQKRREENKARRAAEQEEYEKAESGEVEVDPAVERHVYEKELLVIAELVRYCNYYAPKKAKNNQAEEAKENKTVADRNAAFGGKGVAAFVKKGADVDAEFAEVIGTGKKVKKEKTRKVKDSKINHIPDVFSKFKSIGVETPLLASQIATALTALDERKSYYETAPPPEKKGKKEKKAAAKKEEAAPAAAESPEVLAEEKETRSRNRRKSVSLATAEQLRRVAEQANVDKEFEQVEATERSQNRRKSLSLMTAEQQERIAEAAAQALQSEKEAKQEKAANIAMAVALAEGERQRRISATAEDVVEVRQMRRASIDAAVAMADIERARRLASAAPAATGGDLKEQLSDAESQRVGGAAAAAPAGGDLLSQLAAAEKARLGL